MILTEQNFTNLNRRYYQGRVNNYQKKFADFNIEFLTTHFEYAVFYAQKTGTVTEYNLKNNINVFNANCKTDIEKLQSFSLPQFNTKVSDYWIKSLQNKDWAYALGPENKLTLLNLLFNLGYDGIFNFEYSDEVTVDFAKAFNTIMSLNNEPAIGVINKDCFIKHHEYNGFEEYKKCIDFEASKKREKSQLIKVLSSMTQTSDEIKNNFTTYASCLTTDEIDDVIKDFQNDKERKLQEMIFNRTYLRSLC